MKTPLSSNLYNLVQMICRIENIQLILEDNTRINMKCTKPIIAHDLKEFREDYKKLVNKHRPAVKRLNLTYEEYDNRQ